MLVYIGNITIYSPTLKQKIPDLDSVFACLEAANLKVSISMTRMSNSEDFFLGHTVSAAEIRPHPHQVKAMKRMKAPVSAKEVRRSLGAVNFYYLFISGCLILADFIFQLI